MKFKEQQYDKEGRLRHRRFEIDARIISHSQTREDAFEIVLEAPPIASSAMPGQFVEILFGENYSPLLRRPFSIFHAEPGAGTVSVLYRRHGSFTSGLKHKSAGDNLSLIGPLGRPFHYDVSENAVPILIAGGIGAPPISFLAERLASDFRKNGRETQDIVVINAARTSDHLIGISALKALQIDLRTVTNDGTAGFQGTALEVLQEVLIMLPETAIPQIFACGPMPMLRSISNSVVPLLLPCQLSIETPMPCGIGTCAGCAVVVRDTSNNDGFRYALACTDGPIFEATDLIW